ncbi:IS66 family transposase [bacterium]|nr:IS66 family transposase [Chloroflexi bacterium CFX6]RIL12165.1 MAG: IS66 family transposase [bacterium]
MLKRLRVRGNRTTVELEVERLQAENLRLRVLVAELRAENAEMQQRIAVLESKLATNSRNSSKPPSSDGPQVPLRKREPGSRGRGGQPGHEGTSRRLVPAEQVDEIVDCRPTSCESCGALLEGDNPAPERHQVVDIPTPKVIVREYRRLRLSCRACGSTTTGALPAGVSDSAFGVGLHTLAAILVGRFRQSKRLVVELFGMLHGLSISPGSICAMEQRVEVALEGPVTEARKVRKSAPVVGKDEISWRHLKSRAWLWVTATECLAVVTITRRRGSVIVKEILGESFGGVVCSDRWSAYAHLERRQLCWARLLRDFTAMVEHFGSPWHGQRRVDCARQVMDADAALRAGEIDHADMVSRLEPVRRRTLDRLTWAAKSAPGPKARAKAQEILKIEDHLWAFPVDATIPVTNNLCERLLRYAVIWRKLSYRTESDMGARFVKRILTVTASIELQHRDVFGYLSSAIDAHFHGQTAPSMLPVTSDAG